MEINGRCRIVHNGIDAWGCLPHFKILLSSCYSSSILNGLFKLVFAFWLSYRCHWADICFLFCFLFFCQHITVTITIFFLFFKVVYVINFNLYKKHCQCKVFHTGIQRRFFVQKFLFEATFLSVFYTISYNFLHKKLSPSNLFKKTYSFSDSML